MVETYGGLLEGVDMAKVMMGQNAFQLPINLIIQPTGDGDKVAGVFQTCHGKSLVFGSKRTHLLILGDAIIRPRIVAASDAFRGSGIDHLFKEGFLEIDKWLAGDILLGRELAKGVG